MTEAFTRTASLDDLRKNVSDPTDPEQVNAFVVEIIEDAPYLHPSVPEEEREMAAERMLRRASLVQVAEPELCRYLAALVGQAGYETHGLDTI